MCAAKPLVYILDGELFIDAALPDLSLMTGFEAYGLKTYGLPVLSALAEKVRCAFGGSCS